MDGGWCEIETNCLRGSRDWPRGVLSPCVNRMKSVKRVSPLRGWQKAARLLRRTMRGGRGGGGGRNGGEQGSVKSGKEGCGQMKKQASKHVSNGKRVVCFRSPIKPVDRQRIAIIWRAEPERATFNEGMTDFSAFTTIRTSCKRTLLLLLVYLVSTSFGDYDGRESPASVSSDRTGADNDFRSCTDGKCIKRTTHEVTSGMWFGPRLGRRRRSDKKAEAEPDFEALANALDGTRWALITIPGGEKRQPTQFTPRLGRESAEESSMYENAADRDEIELDDQVYPPLFAPRLGRRVSWKPSPRLGRQLHTFSLPLPQYTGSNQQYSDRRF